MHCDKYYRCIGGRATEEFCPDGLVFDSMERLSNKCVPVFNVDCGDRDKLREYYFGACYTVKRTNKYDIIKQWNVNE